MFEETKEKGAKRNGKENQKNSFEAERVGNGISQQYGEVGDVTPGLFSDGIGSFVSSIVDSRIALNMTYEKRDSNSSLFFVLVFNYRHAFSAPAAPWMGYTRAAWQSCG